MTEMTEQNADKVQLEYLRGEHEKITSQLNDKIIELGEAKARVQCLDAEMKKLSNMKELVLENIREQKLIINKLYQ